MRSRDVPADRVRLHVCWGNYEGSHVHDMDCRKIFPIVCKVKPRALLVEGANPRHEHEWEAWKTIPLPDDKVLIPGVIGSNTNYVEHPEVVAQRIERYASVVGRERVMAGIGLRIRHFRGLRRGFPGVLLDENGSPFRGRAHRIRPAVGKSRVSVVKSQRP